LSSPTGSPRFKAVVCGSAFGQVYMEAFRRPDLPFELAGIVAKGSPRSQACARLYGVPLFTDIAALPDDIRAACVVVRGGLLGGDGCELAKALMARGIHVLQEHPLHHDELADCLRHARRHRVVYQLNTFYVHLAPVMQFLAAARELLTWQRPAFIDAASSFQVAYALLDIIASALGTVRPWKFSTVPLDQAGAASTSGPFRTVIGELGGVPITLRIQNQLDPTDPDANAHLLHRVTLGVEGGSLTLVETHGPIVWSVRPQIPRQVHDSAAAPLYSTDHDWLDEGPSSIVLGPPDAPCFRSIYSSLWPQAVTQALCAFHQAVVEDHDGLPRGQYHLMLCRMWQDIAGILGPPDLVRQQPPRRLPPEAVAALTLAARTARASERGA
jgi:pyochelin biosynthesis protein PchG